MSFFGLCINNHKLLGCKIKFYDLLINGIYFMYTSALIFCTYFYFIYLYFLLKNFKGEIRMASLLKFRYLFVLCVHLPPNPLGT